MYRINNAKTTSNSIMDGDIYNLHFTWGPSLSDIKDHDRHCHGRFLSDVGLPLGGDGKPTETGFYFTNIKIGQPSEDYYVHVDTGSDLFWVNCIHYSQCPKKSNLGIQLTLYDPSNSVSSETITCDQCVIHISYVELVLKMYKLRRVSMSSSAVSFILQAYGDQMYMFWARSIVGSSFRNLPNSDARNQSSLKAEFTASIRLPIYSIFSYSGSAFLGPYIRRQKFSKLLND